MGLVHIYCGDGKGKTTASVGLALRALGTGMKVLFVQFFKDGSSGEISPLMQNKNLTYLKSEQDFKRFACMAFADKPIAKECYTTLFNKAVSLCADYDLVVFDEIISTYNYEMLCKSDVLNFLNSKKTLPEIVLTGRDPAPELCNLADYITEMKKIKHPFDSGVAARKGIEY